MGSAFQSEGSVSSRCCLAHWGSTCRLHMPPVGPCVLQPLCHDGCGVNCCQLGARGDRLCLCGICLGGCQSLDAASGWRLGHIACSGEQAACSGRWHPSSGLQAASGTLLGQGIVLASGPSRGSVFGEVAQSLDLQVGLVLFPTTLHTSLGKGHLATPVFPHCFGCIAAATCL